MKQFGILMILCVAVLAACASNPGSVGVEQGMIDAVQTYTSGMYSQDFDKAASASCLADQASLKTALQEIAASLPEKLVGNFDASGIVFTVASRTGDVVLLQIVSGKGKMDAVLTGSTPQPLTLNLLPPTENNALVLKLEGGSWKVCRSAASALLTTAPVTRQLSTFDVSVLARLGVASLAGFALIYFGWRLLALARRARIRDEEVRANGVLIEAEIIERIAPSNIIYRYAAPQADGTTEDLGRKVQITPKDYARLKVGDHIQVRYLPDHPEKHIIESGVEETVSTSNLRKQGILFTSIGVIILVALAVVAIQVVVH